MKNQNYFVDKESSLGGQTQIGLGSYIEKSQLADGVFVGDYSKITGATIGYETKIWHYVNIYGCVMGEKNTVGSYTEIASGLMIAAGSVVTRDVPPHTLVAGNPAKIIRSLKEELR